MWATYACLEPELCLLTEVCFCRSCDGSCIYDRVKSVGMPLPVITQTFNRVADEVIMDVQQTMNSDHENPEISQ